MAYQLKTFFEDNNQSDKEQHSFQTGKSVTTASVDFVKSVINSMDKGDKLVGVFMDLGKAIDSVSHLRLLYIFRKLEKNRALLWFNLHLENRKKFVEIAHLTKKFNQLINHNSMLRNVNYGFPQGFILGPLLFL